MLHRTIGMMAFGGRIVLMTGQEAEPEVPLKEFHSANLSLLGVSMSNTLPDLQRKCAEALNARYTYGSWRPRVGMTLSLSQAAAAQQMYETTTATPGGTMPGTIVVVPRS
jgi:NADPH:quinone reductase-like Zn-dependent oxidoreductase